MSNRSKARGTAAETALMRWFRNNGFPGADRQPLRGNRDSGDLTLCPGLVVEVKSHNGATGLGQPPPAMLDRWLAECETEMINAGAAYCPLIVKRAGTTDPGRWWAYLPLGAFVSLYGGRVPIAAPVCLSVESLTAVLRYAGYGTTTQDI